jgi:hypothetical protein
MAAFAPDMYPVFLIGDALAEAQALLADQIETPHGRAGDPAAVLARIRGELDGIRAAGLDDDLHALAERSEPAFVLLDAVRSARGELAAGRQPHEQCWRLRAILDSDVVCAAMLMLGYFTIPMEREPRFPGRG